jgi:hypothetical protein
VVRVTRRELAALAVASLGLLVGWRALRWGLEAGEPRRAVVRQIRAEADPRRDLVVVTDEAPELLAAAAPVPALYGTPPLDDLAGLRRLYVVAPGPAALVPYLVRLGAPAATFGPAARRWDLAGVATVRLDLATTLLDRVTARREGGVHEGPCPRSGGVLQCRTADEHWNSVRAESHTFDGVSVTCIFAHPQADGRLVLEARDLPPARTLVGAAGIDDVGARHPAGAPVSNRIRFEPAPGAGGAPVERTFTVPNRRGAVPYRLDLGGRAGTLTFTITTPDAGARQYCFTARLTD